MLQTEATRGRMLTVKGGWLICPVCRRNKHLLRIPPDTIATRLPVYCRDCKSELLIDIDAGQCYESRSR